MIAEMGGYIGLFLGVSLLQFHKVLEIFLKKFESFSDQTECQSKQNDSGQTSRQNKINSYLKILGIYKLFYKNIKKRDFEAFKAL